jgi:hypothetical protein
MSPDTDRIAIPTNGHGPPPEPDSIEPQVSEPSTLDRPERPASGPPTAPISPMQVAVGFAIIASIIAILARRLRRRQGGRPGPADGG